MMTCRAARLYQDLRVDVVCCECGSPNLEASPVSMDPGPHLCQVCARSMADCGAAQDNTTHAPQEAPCAV